jgi:hypothetical protein
MLSQVKLHPHSLSKPERFSCFLGERSRLGCCSVRLAPNIGGMAITKRWINFERLCEPRGVDSTSQSLPPPDSAAAGGASVLASRLSQIPRIKIRRNTSPFDTHAITDLDREGTKGPMKQTTNQPQLRPREHLASRRNDAAGFPGTAPAPGAVRRAPRRTFPAWEITTTRIKLDRSSRPQGCGSIRPTRSLSSFSSASFVPRLGAPSSSRLTAFLSLRCKFIPLRHNLFRRHSKLFQPIRGGCHRPPTLPRRSAFDVQCTL